MMMIDVFFYLIFHACRTLFEENTSHLGETRHRLRGWEPTSEHHHHSEPRACSRHLEEVGPSFSHQFMSLIIVGIPRQVKALFSSGTVINKDRTNVDNTDISLLAITDRVFSSMETQEVTTFFCHEALRSWFLVCSSDFYLLAPSSSGGGWCWSTNRARMRWACQTTINTPWSSSGSGAQTSASWWSRPATSLAATSARFSWPWQVSSVQSTTW